MTNQIEESQNESCSAAPPSYLEPDQKELTRIIKNFKKDYFGCISLGKDGVLRMLNTDRNVIDAEGLRPELIEAFQQRLPPVCREEFGDTDGTTVPREQWFYPDKELLPAPLTLAEKEATIKAMQTWEAFNSGNKGL